MDPGKLRVFPYGVDTEFFRPISETLEIRGRRGFCSLYIFPFYWRKGFDRLLKATRREFHGQDDVTLVLKTQSEHNSAADLRRLILGGISEGGGVPRVIVLTEPMDLVQLRRLYNTCDLYISQSGPTAGGRPAWRHGHGEARGDDRLRREHGVHDRGEQLADSSPRGRWCQWTTDRSPSIVPGHRWAEVRVEEVRRVLRLAYADRDVLARLARQGMQDVRERYSHLRAAERMRDYLMSVDVPRRSLADLAYGCGGALG